MGALKVLAGVLGAANAGLALAAKQIEVDSTPVGSRVSQPDAGLRYPSQSESAALLDAALWRAREEARVAAS
ncbi:MAG: hypothetical protein ACRDNY_07425 [Gaiellaceae bacterium]